MKTRDKKAVAAKTQVMLVDDHPIVRFGVKSLLEHDSSIEVVTEAENSREAMEKFRPGQIQLVLVDISIPGNGIELVKSLRAIDPAVRILVVSMHDEAVYAERALKAGAQGYIMKKDATLNLSRAVQTVLADEVYVSGDMMKLMLRKASGLSAGASGGTAEELLSDRELEVYDLIGQGYQGSEISHMLGVSIKTVETYQENIKKKLHIPSAAELRRHAIQWRNSREG